MSSIVALTAAWGKPGRPGLEGGAAPAVREVDGNELIAQMANPLIVVDRGLRCVSANPAMAALCRRPLLTMIGRRVTELFPVAMANARRAFALLDDGANVVDYEMAWKGSLYQLSIRALAAEGHVNAIVVTATDVTRHARIEERLRRSRRRLLDDSRRDHLTGLLNRRGLDASLRKNVASAQRSDLPLSVLIIDIDWFKSYNDQLGHLAGDQCLRLVAAALRQEVERAGGEIARYGGEEFVALLPGADGVTARQMADELRSAILAMGLDHPASMSGRVTVSIGVAALERGFCSPGSGTQQRLLRAADDALYLAKVSGRNRVRVFAAAPAHDSERDAKG